MGEGGGAVTVGVACSRVGFRSSFFGAPALLEIQPRELWLSSVRRRIEGLGALVCWLMVLGLMRVRAPGLEFRVRASW